MDKHEINNFQQLIKIIRPHELSFEARTKYPLQVVSEKIMDFAEKCVDKDTSTWIHGYNALPLDFIDHPDHPLCLRFGQLLEKIWTFTWNKRPTMDFGIFLGAGEAIQKTSK